MSTLGEILARTPVASIEEVIERMRDLVDVLPTSDGIGYFNRLYLKTTENILGAEKQNQFGSNVFVNALDVIFANLYFAALADLEAGRAPPRAWAPLFAARDRDDIAPLQFAMAGMNAHINRDLPEALVQTFTALGVDLVRPSAQSNDYDAVNEVLAATEVQMRDFYFTPLMKELDREFDGVEDVVANWSVRSARATAWTNGTALWHLRAHTTLAADYLDGLDAMVGFAGRGLLVSTARAPAAATAARP